MNRSELFSPHWIAHFYAHDLLTTLLLLLLFGLRSRPLRLVVWYKQAADGSHEERDAES